MKLYINIANKWKNLNFAQKTSIVIFLVALVWMLSGFAKNSKTSDDIAINNNNQIQKVRVKNSVAKLTPSEIIIKGITVADKKVELKAETTATVSKILKKKGERVKKGELIIKLSSDDRDSKLQKAKSLVEQKRIQYNASKDLIEKGYNSKVRFAESEAELESAKAQLEEIKLDIERTKIKAPFDGVLDDRYVEVGDYVEKGNNLTRIVDLDPIKITAEISEFNIGFVQKDSKAEIKLLNGKEFDAKLKYVSSVANAKTRTFNIELNADNKNYEISEGLTTEIVLHTKARFAHLVSPATLALDGNGEVGIKCVDSESKIIFYTVNIIKQTNDGIWVAGLPKDASIITVGQDFVSEGQKVIAVEESKSIL